MLNRKRIIVFASLIVLHSCALSQAAGDYRSFASGTWATIGNWERYNGVAWVAAATAPTFADGVITIQSPHTIQITANVTIDQVTINLGGTVNWTGGTCTIAAGAGVDLQIDGTFWDNRGVAATSITFNAGATWQMGAVGTLIRSAGNSSNNWQANYQGGIATIPSTSFWILRKTTAQNPTISTTTPATGSFYPNLIIENNFAGLWTTAAGSTFMGTTAFPTVKGYLDIGGTGTSTVNFLNQHTFTTPTLVVGNVNVRAGNTFSNYGTGIEIQGNLIVNGTVNYAAGAGARRIIFSGANAQTISGTGTLNIYDLTLNKSTNNVTLNRAIAIDNLFTLTAGLMISTTVNLVTVAALGSVAGASNASFVSGPIRYLGTNAFTFPVGKNSDYQSCAISASVGGGGTFWTENFENSCASGCFASGYSGVNGAWGVTLTGPNFDVGSYNIWYVSCAENGNAAGACGTGCGSDESLHMGSQTLGDIGAAYDAGGLCGFFWCITTDQRAESPTINCTGQFGISLNFNYIENGQGSTDNATVWYFDGTTWTQIDDPPKVVLCGVQGTWTARTIVLPASADNNPNVKIGFRWVNDDDGGGVDPSFAVDDITLSTASAASSFTCEYFYSNPQIPYGNLLVPSLSSISNCEYWILSRDAGTFNKNVTLAFDANSCLLPPLTSDLRVARYDGISTWQNEGNSGTTGTIAAGTVTSNSVTSFSPFTIGSIVPVVLPISLLEFNAKPIDKKVICNWITASELNNDYFEIQRSADGNNFISIGNIDGAGTSSNRENYVFYDANPLNGLSYYRLKQTDFDGRFTYSAIRPVNFKVDDFDFTVYPNPVSTNEVFVQFNNVEISAIRVSDVSGRPVAFEQKKTNSTSNKTILVFPNKLPSGTYLVTFETTKGNHIRRLVAN